MFRTILLFIYISALLDAKVLGLDSLLTKYNQESERYKQTKKDAGGEFIVFTREDLYYPKKTKQHFEMSYFKYDKIRTIKRG